MKIGERKSFESVGKMDVKTNFCGKERAGFAVAGPATLRRIFGRTWALRSLEGVRIVLRYDVEGPVTGADFDGGLPVGVF